MTTLTRIKTPRCLTPDHVVLLVALQLAGVCRMCAAGTYLQDFDQDLTKKQVRAIIDYWVAKHGKEQQMETQYYITFYVRGNDEVEDEYPTIATGFSDVKTATKFAEQTVGTVEVVGIEYNDETKLWDKTEEHIGFLDGVEQYHDEG